MVKQSYPQVKDQFDSKVFRESLGSFGTTTKPGGNQLQELQVKARQGVKHVELHLSSKGKGQFGAQDTPDKYGFNQRKSIMHLAKLNNQTLSVHSTFDVTSFSGLTQQGFSESERLDTIREIDESVKFAAETAKGGAVVMHMQGEGLSSKRADIRLSSNYLKWLEENSKHDEKLKQNYDNIKKNYFGDIKDKQFIENPLDFQDREKNYNRLSDEDRLEFSKTYSELIERRREKNPNISDADLYYEISELNNLKNSKDYGSTVVIGNKVEGIDRRQKFIDLNILEGNLEENFSKDEIDALKKEGIVFPGSQLNDEQLAKAQATFSNGYSPISDMDPKIFKSIKRKLLLDYEKFYENNNNSQVQTDAEFFKEFSKYQIRSLKIQRESLENKYKMHDLEFKRVSELENNKTIIYNEIVSYDKKLKDAKTDEEKKKIEGIQTTLKGKLSEIGSEISNLRQQEIGYDVYQELNGFNQKIAQINEKINELKEQQIGTKNIADYTFDKNVTGVSHIGLKALSYQLDLKEKSKEAKKTVEKLRVDIKQKKQKYYTESDFRKQDELAAEISILEKKEKNLSGVSDYDDIDMLSRPLYISPENMLPGMGNLCSIEEIKAVLRMSQDDFANKILDENNQEYKDLRDRYEKETGVKINDKKSALKLAKKHIAGTFDSAHAAAWIKHFRYKDGETEEQRLEAFNTWMNQQAEDMVREGLVKHVHLNDSSGKEDDHNSIGEGILDLHDLRKRLRGAQAEGAELDKAFIVEAGGRGADKLLHLQSAFDLFNPTMFNNSNNSGNYRLQANSSIDSGVSDWVSVKRDYQNRPQYSSYGLGDSTFRHQAPQQGRESGSWSGTSFF